MLFNGKQLLSGLFHHLCALCVTPDRHISYIDPTIRIKVERFLDLRCFHFFHLVQQLDKYFICRFQELNDLIYILGVSLIYWLVVRLSTFIFSNHLCYAGLHLSEDKVYAIRRIFLLFELFLILFEVLIILDIQLFCDTLPNIKSFNRGIV